MVTQLKRPLYTAEASVQGGREGHGHSSDDVLDLDLRPPKEMGGPGGATNPEQLFALGYAACFQSALAVVGRRERVDTAGSTVTARVTIGEIGGGRYGLAAALPRPKPSDGAGGLPLWVELARKRALRPMAFEAGSGRAPAAPTAMTEAQIGCETSFWEARTDWSTSLASSSESSPAAEVARCSWPQASPPPSPNRSRWVPSDIPRQLPIVTTSGP